MGAWSRNRLSGTGAESWGGGGEHHDLAPGRHEVLKSYQGEELRRKAVYLEQKTQQQRSRTHMDQLRIPEPRPALRQR